MCSRYFLDADGNIIAYTFRVDVKEPVQRRYNIAPTQLAPVIRADAPGSREIAILRWGLVPSWAKEIGVGNRMINARSEGVETKPAFRAAVAERRCIIPATGFFEWQGAPGRKQPYAITVADRPLFGFAGLWERWVPRGGDPVETFTIMTVDANPAVAEVHDRMPVILPPEAYDRWLSPVEPDPRDLLVSYPDAPMTAWPVSSRVNSVANDDASLLERATEPNTRTLL